MKKPLTRIHNSHNEWKMTRYPHFPLKSPQPTANRLFSIVSQQYHITQKKPNHMKSTTSIKRC